MREQGFKNSIFHINLAQMRLFKRVILRAVHHTLQAGNADADVTDVTGNTFAAICKLSVVSYRSILLIHVTDSELSKQ